MVWVNVTFAYTFAFYNYLLLHFCILYMFGMRCTLVDIEIKSLQCIATIHKLFYVISSSKFIINELLVYE